MSDKFEFKYVPLEVVHHLDRYIYGQTQAKEALATSICIHYRRITNKHSQDLYGDNLKNHVMLIGPTGSGKTRLVKLASKFIGVPFLEINAPDYTASGYVGKDVEQIPYDLLDKAKNDLESAQRGIVFVDEVDKIADDHSGRRDIRGGAVQDQMLKMVEETEYSVRIKSNNYFFSTANTLFIFSGAFEKLDEISKARLKTNTKLGFNDAPITAPVALHNSGDIVEDLVEYGIRHQLLGRIGTIGLLEKLSEDSLYQILIMDGSEFLRSRINDFGNVGIDLNFTEEAVRHIAKKAYAKNTGGRSLNQILAEVCTPFYTYLPSTDISELKITPEVVDNPHGSLEKILKKYPVHPIHDIEEEIGEFSTEISHKSRYGKRKKNKLELKCISKDDSKIILTKDEYLSRLPQTIPSYYREEAWHYGRKNSQSPNKIPEILSQLKIGIREYCFDFYSKYQKRLVLSDDVKKEITKIALHMGTLNVPRVMFSRIGRIIDDGKRLQRIKPKVLKFDNQSFFDPESYLRTLEEKTSQ